MKIGGDKDHIHILYAQSRVWSIAKIVEVIKKRSSKWIKTKGDKFRLFRWQNGYGAFSVSRSSAESVKRYIQNQKEHHKRVTFKNEFRVFLDKHEIEYDEEYVWD